MLLNHEQEWGLKRLREAPFEHIIGIDEVGLGACAGPLVVCGAVFQKSWADPAVKDSKAYGSGRKAHEKRREVKEKHIQPWLLHHELEVVTHADIDAIGLGFATQDAMRRIAMRCGARYPEAAIALDGDYRPVMRRSRLVVNMPKGDALIPAVSAASVLAKVTRDGMMYLFHDLYPNYGFEDHVGYWTEKHKEAVLTHGLLPCHRRTYKNIREIVARQGRGSI